MNAVQIVIFTLCIYQISAVIYEEAVASCKKKSKFENDVPIDYFFQQGSWPADTSEERACFFNCVGKELGMVDSQGKPDQNKLADIASKHKNVPELQVLSLPSSFSTCASQATGSSECEVTKNYVSCAVKNAPKP